MGDVIKGITGAVGGLFGGGGSSAPSSYVSPYTKQMDTQLQGKLSGALNSTGSTPNYYGGQNVGNTSSNWGFGNKTLTNPYQASSISNGGYTPTNYTMPTAYNNTTGAYGQIMNGAARDVLRSGQGAIDQATRAAQLSGGMSPANLKNLALQSQQAGQQKIGDMSVQGAVQIAPQIANAEMETQKNNDAAQQFAASQNSSQSQAQATENARAQGLTLQGQQQALQGEQAAGQLGETDTANQQAYLSNLMQQVGSNYIQPYTATGQRDTGSPFSRALGGAAGAAAPGAIGSIASALGSFL